MDIHQKLILLALGCFAFMVIAEYVTEGEIMLNWWWSPIEIERLWLRPSTPTLIGFTLLLLALCVREA